MSLRDLLLQTVSTPARKDVSHLIPGLNGQGPVYVQELTGRQRHQWTIDNQKAAKEGFNPADASARLVILSVVGADGTPVFRPEDRDALLAGGSGLLSKLVDIASNLSGLYWREEDSLPNAPRPLPSNAPPPAAP